MPADQQEPESGSFAQIKPAAIQLSQAASGSAGAPPHSGRSPAVWIGLALLVATAAMVTFILPGRMQPPAVPAPTAESKTAATPQHSAPPAATPAPSEPGPFSDAEKARLRRESQDLLQEALEIQQALQKISVETWAPADYAAAVQFAQSGDVAYREQDFEKSRSFYEQALAGFKGLEVRAGQVHAESMERGRVALTEGQSAAAAEAFRTALMIRPEDADAAAGLKRAGTLDQLLALVTQGDGLVQQERLDEARQAYVRAGALDPEAVEPKRQLAALDQIIMKRKFTAAMSRGYAALENGELEKAAGAFRDAAAIMPGAAEAKSALNQTQQKLTTANIGRFLNEAAAMEQAERWPEAMQRYDSALALDPNLPQARQGKEQAARRAGLDERLRAAIAQPDRLADDTVHAEGEALRQEAAAIPAPGPALKKQIAVLMALLEQAIIPVKVTLLSDGATSVTVFKVGTLGQFESRELALRPGRYVAVGKRPGYRDVRVEFSVAAEQAPGPVTVACAQKIAM